MKKEVLLFIANRFPDRESASIRVRRICQGRQIQLGMEWMPLETAGHSSIQAWKFCYGIHCAQLLSHHFTLECSALRQRKAKL